MEIGDHLVIHDSGMRGRRREEEGGGGRRREEGEDEGEAWYLLLSLLCFVHLSKTERKESERRREEKGEGEERGGREGRGVWERLNDIHDQERTVTRWASTTMGS